MIEEPAMQSAEPTNQGPLQTLSAYALDLELEVDRLRSREQFLQQEAWEHVRQILRLCRSAAPEDAADRLAAIAETCGPFSELLHDLNDPPLPAFDRVVDIAVRPLAEQAFRWQQRLSGAGRANCGSISSPIT